MLTFVQSKWTLVFNDFSKTVDDAIINFGINWLGLQSDFDDFEGLHDKDL
jgi:hypothetical protein